MNNLYHECPTCFQISDIHPCPICNKETRRREPAGGLFRSTIEIPIPRFMGWHRVLIDQGTHLEEAKIEGFAHDPQRKVIQVTLKVPPYSIGRRCLTQRFHQGKLVDEIDHGKIIPSQNE